MTPTPLGQLLAFAPLLPWSLACVAAIGVKRASGSSARWADRRLNLTAGAWVLLAIIFSQVLLLVLFVLIQKVVRSIHPPIVLDSGYPWASVVGALIWMVLYDAAYYVFHRAQHKNVSSLSDHAARGDRLTGIFYLLIVVVFVLGASSSTLFINAGRRRQVRSIYAITILIEGVLLIALGLVELWIPSLQKGPVLILGLSYLMGLQNAVVTHISNARVRTTHVLGMSTDIGIELSMLFDIARGKEESSEAAQYKSRLRLHTQTVLSFLGGTACCFTKP